MSNKLPDVFKNVKGDLEKLKKEGLISDDIEKEFEGYAPEKPMLTFMQIRQKPLTDEKGKIVTPAGGFKFTDGRQDMEEVWGIILMSQAGRVYFEKPGDTQPKCKSLNGITSIYGDNCLECPHYHFKKDGSSPDCKTLRNVLFIIEKGANDYEPVIWTIGPSGLKRWREFILNCKHAKIPPHALLVKLTTEFVKEKGEYYIPVIEVKEILSTKLMKKIKEERDKLLTFFGTTIEKSEVRVEEDEVVEVKTEEPEKSPEEMEKEILEGLPELDIETRRRIITLLNVDIKKAYELYKNAKG